MIGICFAVAVASFVVGFLSGDSLGTKDTERRWSEAVARSDYRGRLARQSVEISEALSIAGCPAMPLPQAVRLLIEQRDRLLALIYRLKKGTCWCDFGIGNPSAPGHSPHCRAAAAAVGETL
jgi:hypothetical protein